MPTRRGDRVPCIAGFVIALAAAGARAGEITIHYDEGGIPILSNTAVTGEWARSPSTRSHLRGEDARPRPAWSRTVPPRAPFVPPAASPITISGPSLAVADIEGDDATANPGAPPPGSSFKTDD